MPIKPFRRKQPTLADKIKVLEESLAREKERTREYAIRIHELESLPGVEDAEKLQKLEKLAADVVRLLALRPPRQDEDDIVSALEGIRKALDIENQPQQSIAHAVDDLATDKAVSEETEAEKVAAEQRADALADANYRLIEDRKALLAKLGLNEYQWWLAGGEHPAHLDYDPAFT